MSGGGGPLGRIEGPIACLVLARSLAVTQRREQLRQSGQCFQSPGVALLGLFQIGERSRQIAALFNDLGKCEEGLDMSRLGFQDSEKGGFRIFQLAKIAGRSPDAEQGKRVRRLIIVSGPKVFHRSLELAKVEQTTGQSKHARG